MPSHWSRTKENERLAQRLEAATRPTNLVPSRTFVNSTMSERYTGNNMRSARSDADQHFQFSSAPMGAQIVPHSNTNHSPESV